MTRIDDLKVPWESLRRRNDYQEAYNRYLEVQYDHHRFCGKRFFGDFEEHSLTEDGQRLRDYVLIIGLLIYNSKIVDWKEDRFLLKNAIVTILDYIPRKALTGFLRQIRIKGQKPTRIQAEKVILHGLRQEVERARYFTIVTAQPFYPVLDINNRLLYPISYTWDFQQLKDFLVKRNLHIPFARNFHRSLTFNPYAQRRYPFWIDVSIDVRDNNERIIEQLRKIIVTSQKV